MELKLVLLLLSAARLTELSVQGDPVPGAMMPWLAGRTKIKLCGKVLQAALEVACGTSHLKRRLLQEEVKSSGRERTVQTDSNKDQENMKLQSASDPKLKQSQNDHPPDKEPSWEDFYKDYEKYILAATSVDWKRTDFENMKLHLAVEPEQKLPQYDRPPEPSWTDFLELYTNEKEYISADIGDAGQESADSTGLDNPDGSVFPQVKYLTKKPHDVKLKMEDLCCNPGCKIHDIFSTLCVH